MSFPSRRAVGLLDLLPDDERTRLGDRVRTRMDFFPGPVWATETSSTCAYAGNGTIVYTGRLGYSEAPVMIGIASCSPTDTFDYDVGTRIAYVRCAEAGYRWVQGNIDPNELHGE